jgi:hypothetical protein
MRVRRRQHRSNFINNRQHTISMENSRPTAEVSTTIGKLPTTNRPKDLPVTVFIVADYIKPGQQQYCSATNLQCFNCGRLGHVAKVCRSRTSAASTTRFSRSVLQQTLETRKQRHSRDSWNLRDQLINAVCFAFTTDNNCATREGGHVCFLQCKYGPSPTTNATCLFSPAACRQCLFIHQQYRYRLSRNQLQKSEVFACDATICAISNRQSETGAR